MTSARRSNAVDHLFNPNNVVLVGASDRPDHWSGRVWGNLKRFGYQGRIFPVNPNRQEIWGTPCYPNVAALPEPPDHLAIFTPAETTVRLLRDGAAAGARSATVYAASFGEGGNAEGRELGMQLRSAIAETGIAVVGPNCMGVASGVSKFSTVPDETLHELVPGPIAVVVQSGAMATSLNRAINDLDLKSAYLASCGSQFGCTVADFIDYLADDEHLRVILCYIEGIPDAVHFLEAARRARHNGKIVVAVKIGGSESSRAAALAHTGSLAGSAQVFEAIASAAGVVYFPTFEDAIEAVEFLARQPLPKGRNIAVLTSSGALRSLVSEAAERVGATLATLSKDTEAALCAVLEHSDVSNPLDSKRTIPTKQYAGCLDAFVDAPEVDIVMVAEELPQDQGVERRLSNLRSVGGVARRAATLGKSVAVSMPLVMSTTDDGRRVRAELPDVPFLRGMDRSVRVVGKLAEVGGRPLHTGAFLDPPSESELARRWRERAVGLNAPTALNEVESKDLLRAYSIPIPDERLAKTADEAATAANAIGYPVVLKAVSAKLPHKSDAGMVVLHLRDADAVRRAAQHMLLRAEALSVSLDGLLVAKEVTGGTECVLGVQRDVEMGPVVMFGLGGVLIELFKDVAFAPAFLDHAQARAMVQSTRAGRLLQGFRGGRPADIDALCDALVNLGRLARELGDVIEAIDVNPFLVRERGAFALDGLVVLRPPST